MTIAAHRRILSARRWTPPPAAPDQGRTPLTRALQVERRLPTGGRAPEDVQFDADGRIVTGLAGGAIVRLDPDTGAREVLADTGGRPLGIDLCADGSVLVCDHDRGLLRAGADGTVEVLVAELAGEPLRFASNVAHAPDGTVWFTTSTARWDLAHHEGDILEHSCTGRLARRDPDGTVTVLVDGLAFGNGLVLAPDGSHLVYAETAAYRLCRYWLAGPRAGTTDVLVDNLPGFPDNLSLGSDGLLWAGIASPRTAAVDRLLPLPGLVRTLAWNLPSALRPGPVPVAWAMAFDLGGATVHDLRSEDVGYDFVTAAAERDGLVALAGLHGTEVLLCRLP